MGHFIDYVCRGVVNSENAIRRIARDVKRLSKCNRGLAMGMVGLAAAGLLMTLEIAYQNKEIEDLKEKVDDLTTKMEDEPQQKGA